MHPRSFRILSLLLTMADSASMLTSSACIPSVFNDPVLFCANASCSIAMKIINPCLYEGMCTAFGEWYRKKTQKSSREKENSSWDNWMGASTYNRVYTKCDIEKRGLVEIESVRWSHFMLLPNERL